MACITMSLSLALPWIAAEPVRTWRHAWHRATSCRRLAALGSVVVIVTALMSLLGWLAGGGALLFAGEAFQAPRPSRLLMMFLNGAALLLLSLRALRRARVAAWLAIGVGGALLVAAMVGHSPFMDRWAAALAPALVSAPIGPTTVVQSVLALFPGIVILLLARTRVTDRMLLFGTALGMSMVGGALVMSIVHAARLTTAAPPALGPVSVVGLLATVLLAISIFLLIADRQRAPQVPPRWGPEMAGVLSVVCTGVLWRALDQRTAATVVHSSALPTIALLLGLSVSGLLYLSLRLLRSNWLQAQRLAHAALARAFETASNGVWEYDLRSRRMRRGETQLRHLGYVPAFVNDYAGAWLSLIHPDDRPHVLAHDAARRRGRDDAGELTYRVRAATGVFHTIIDRGRVVERTADGSPALVLGISADVTERERADRARRDSERRFRAIFESALQGQILLDEFGTCLEVNTTALHIVGAQRDDVLGMPLPAGPWFTGLTEARQRVEQALAKTGHGHSVRFEADAHLLDGRIGRVEVSLTPLRCDAGTVQQMLCEMRDVTERRKSEEALREIGALTTMGRLAARVAHEINNPLAGIQNAFLLLGDAVPADHPHRRFLLAIEREIQRIASVTRSLYETYRQDAPAGAAGSMPLAVHDAVTFLDQLNRSRQVRIRADLRRAPAHVPVPDALLRQTLYNLVQNAVEASPVGGEVSIVVETSGNDCVIRVHDEGVRVPDDMRERIFEPLSGARTAALRTGSMGIGLSLVRQSVRALGGTVTLLDTPAHGATFEVRLPMTSVLYDPDQLFMQLSPAAAPSSAFPAGAG